MSKCAVQAENLGKLFRIGTREESQTLGEAITNAVAASFRFARGSKTHRPKNTIWALKNISFSIEQGEIVGIIGRNGSGKSTLLKILSRISDPTEGFAEVRGRVGSLLEVGTGFHGDLSGRENIYLNGAILGMRQAEVARKFDEIVAFADVEKFVDTPVKRFSSGMYLRLAFAVAAHLEPEILMVDEVLAVGDANFQKKCLGKMEEVGKEGRTVLFVSHNMPAIKNLCGRAILLDQGKIVKDATPHEVVSTYFNSEKSTMAEREWNDITKSPAGEVARLRAVRILTDKGEITETVDVRKPIAIEMMYEVTKEGYVLLPYFDFYNEEGIHAMASHDLDPVWQGRKRALGVYTSTVWIPGNLMSEGIHYVTAGLTTVDPVIGQFHERDAVAFNVIDSYLGDSARGNWKGPLGGAAVRPLLLWNTKSIS